MGYKLKELPYDELELIREALLRWKYELLDEPQKDYSATRIASIDFTLQKLPVR